MKESWFKCNEVSAERYLSMDTADFYIDIKAYDYRIKKLSDTEKDHLMNSLETIEQGLRDKYGEHASYKIYFDDFHQAEHKAQWYLLHFLFRAGNGISGNYFYKKLFILQSVDWEERWIKKGIILIARKSGL